MKQFVLCITLFLLMLGGVSTSYAAFPIAQKDAVATAATNEVTKEKTFAERKLGRMVTRVKHIMAPRSVVHDGVKTGWQGIVAISCSFAAIVTLFVGFGFFIPLAVAGIIFGALGVSKKKHFNTGWALAGLLLGCLEIVLLIALVVLIIAALKAFV